MTKVLIATSNYEIQERVDFKLNIIDSINSRLDYNNMSIDEKINRIKNVYNLNHGNGKNNKKKKKKGRNK